MDSGRGIPMRIEAADMERISPWMKKYQCAGTETFIKSPRNDERYYAGLLVLMLATTVVFVLALLETPNNAGSFLLFFGIAPVVALYALVMFLWCRHGKTEVVLGDTIAKTMRFARLGIGWNNWQWSEIQGVWTQDENASIPDANTFQGTIYLKHNSNRQAVLSNLTLREAECLRHSIENRLKLGKFS